MGPRLSGACVVLALLLFLISGTANAQWAEFSIELREGETKVIALTVDAPATLKLVPLYAWRGVENVVVFSPSNVAAGTTLVTIHFMTLGSEERKAISPDLYRVKLEATTAENTKHSLLIYVNLENLALSRPDLVYQLLDNLKLALENRFSALDNKLRILENALANKVDKDTYALLRNDFTGLLNDFNSLKSSLAAREDENRYDNILRQLGALENRVAAMDGRLTALLYERQREVGGGGGGPPILGVVAIALVVCAAGIILWRALTRPAAKVVVAPPKIERSDVAEALKRLGLAVEEGKEEGGGGGG